MSNLIYTIGHSTRTLEEFVRLLQQNGICTLADIRRYPGSRRYPHFSRQSLESALLERGIGYVHFEDLGGRRKPLPDSPNRGIRNDQFRGYADYMATPEFGAAVDRLLAIDGSTAVMCAEAVPWRCHRNFLAEDLIRRRRHRRAHHRTRQDPAASEGSHLRGERASRPQSPRVSRGD